MYSVRLSPRAAQFYAEADPPLARKIARCLIQLENDPRRHNNIKPLQGELAGFLRYRLGDYRLVYEIDEKRRIVNVTGIAHRSQVYD